MNIQFSTALRRLAVLISAVLGALALLVLSSSQSGAAADPYPPSAACAISTSDNTVQPGDSVNIQGSGFPANSTVSLTVHSRTTGLGSIKTDANGSFVDTVQIPSTLVGSDHLIVASSASTTCSFDPFGTQAVSGVTAHRGGGGDSGLATTGFAALTASAIAVVLLAGGLLMLVLGRRRRQG